MHPTTTIDPDGDLLLLLQPSKKALRTRSHRDKHDYGVRMLVSSKHMMLVSSVFKAMLNGNFSEGAELHAEGRVTVPLPDEGRVTVPLPVDNPEAFAILVDIAHCRPGNVPATVTLELLSSIALLVDKYRVHQALGLLPGIWVSKLKHRIPNIYCPNLWSWLFISWVFELHVEFKRVTRTLVRYCFHDSHQDSKFPIPLLIYDSIQKARQRAIFRSYNTVTSTIMMYRNSGDKLICASASEEEFDANHAAGCDAMVLGSLLKSAVDNKLFPPAQEPFHSDTLYTVIGRMLDVTVRTLCEEKKSLERHPLAASTPENHETLCSFENKAEEILQEVGGLDLSEFKPRKKS